tara:strand:+ start:2059 stop:2301 length:243 start_codon:yes stop_codon:yes gene_type:complete
MVGDMFRLIIKKSVIENSNDFEKVCRQLIELGIKTLNDKEKLLKPALWYHLETGFLQKVETKEQLKFAQENDDYQLLFLN